MTINKKLEELYGKYWDELQKEGRALIKKSNGNSKILTNPFLIKVDEKEFKNADLKVMIIGQETWKWSDFGKSIEEEMNGYDDFFLKKDFYEGHRKSAFWKGFNYFKDELSKHYKDRNLLFIWNNISKIAKNDGTTGVSPDIRNLERKYFPKEGDQSIISKEIEIIKPDIVIFLTGGRDNDLRFNFKNIEFSPIALTNPKIPKRNYKIISSLNLENVNKAVRLYHPAYYGGFNYVKKDALKYLIS